MPAAAGIEAALLGITSATADSVTGRAVFNGVGLAPAAAGYGLTLRSGVLGDANMRIDASGPGVALELSSATPLLCANATCIAGARQ